VSYISISKGAQNIGDLVSENLGLQFAVYVDDNAAGRSHLAAVVCSFPLRARSITLMHSPSSAASIFGL
jgi:hypothetical protein